MMPKMDLHFIIGNLKKIQQLLPLIYFYFRMNFQFPCLFQHVHND